MGGSLILSIFTAYLNLIFYVFIYIAHMISIFSISFQIFKFAFALKMVAVTDGISVISMHKIENRCFEKPTKEQRKKSGTQRIWIDFPSLKPFCATKSNHINNKSTWIQYFEFLHCSHSLGMNFSRTCWVLFWNHVAHYFQVTFVALISLLLYCRWAKKRWELGKNINTW